MAPAAMTAAGREAVKRERTAAADGAPARSGRRPRSASAQPHATKMPQPHATKTSQARALKTPQARATTPKDRKAPRTATVSPDHRRRVARPTAPQLPRRVSGPLRGGTTSARAAGAPATPWTPRVSHRSGRRRAAAGTPLPIRAVRLVRTLPDRPLLDRVVRGRTWIALLGVMLVGIVAMQVEMLKLGAGIGRATAQTATLQSRNEVLRASVAAMSDDQRIERIAERYGMIMPGPTDIGFLSVGGHLQKALANIHAPDASAFATTTTTNGAITTRADAATDSAASTSTSYTP